MRVTRSNVQQTGCWCKQHAQSARGERGNKKAPACVRPLLLPSGGREVLLLLLFTWRTRAMRITCACTFGCACMRAGRGPPCVEGRVRGCRQRESAVHENCVRRVRKHERLSAQLFSEWPTHCEPINSYFHYTETGFLRAFKNAPSSLSLQYIVRVLYCTVRVEDPVLYMYCTVLTVHLYCTLPSPSLPPHTAHTHRYVSLLCPEEGSPGDPSVL